MKDRKFNSLKKGTRTFVGNRKAQVGQTLTWLLAFVIIFFLMTLFLISSLVIGKWKVVQPNEIIFSPGFLGDLETSSYEVSFLESEVVFDGKKMSVSEAYLYLIEPFLQEEFLEKSGGIDSFSGQKYEDLINDINYFLREKEITAYGKTFEFNDFRSEFGSKREEFRLMLEENFVDECITYYILAPFLEVEISDRGVSNALSSSPGWVLKKYKGISPNIHLYSKGQDIEIKFYFIETC